MIQNDGWYYHQVVHIPSGCIFTSLNHHISPFHTHKNTTIQHPWKSTQQSVLTAYEARVIPLPPGRRVGNGGEVWAVGVVLAGAAADGERLPDPHQIWVVVALDFPAVVRQRKICSVHYCWNPIIITTDDSNAHTHTHTYKWGAHQRSNIWNI